MWFALQLYRKVLTSDYVESCWLVLNNGILAPPKVMIFHHGAQPDCRVLQRISSREHHKHNIQLLFLELPKHAGFTE